METELAASGPELAEEGKELLVRVEARDLGEDSCADKMSQKGLLSCLSALWTAFLQMLWLLKSYLSPGPFQELI